MSNADDRRALETFGLPEAMPRRAAEQLRETLTDLWDAAHERPPGGLRPDLAAHHSFFNPVAQGKRLRSALLEIEPVRMSAKPPSPTALQIDAQRMLITPEGRIALELVNLALDKPGDDLPLDGEAALQFERELLILYREWGRHRLREVLDYLGGGQRPLQLPAIGGALTLLVNRSDAPERAIKRFGANERAAQAVVDQAFFRPADAFAREISASQRRSREKERLISGWTLHEVTRRLPGALVISDDAVYVAPGHTEELLGLFADELKRRKDLTEDTVAAAFDALVREFRNHSDALAGYGILSERPAHTDTLRTALLRSFRGGGPPR